MAAAAPIALAMSVIGGVVDGAESNRAARSSARVDEENARRTLLLGEQESMQTRRDERRMSGDLIAALGGAGIQLGTGSAADILADSAYQREVEIYNIRSTRAQEAQNLNQRAVESRKAGRAALVSSIFGGVGKALAGVEDIRASRAATAQRERERQSQRAPRMTLGG